MVSFNFCLAFLQESSFLGFFSMANGKFWFENNETFESLDKYVPSIGFWIKKLRVDYYNASESKSQAKWFHYGLLTNEGNLYGQPQDDSDIAVWKPSFHDLYFGQCYTLQLDQSKKYIALTLEIRRRLKIYPHSPGRIRAIPNPAWYHLELGSLT